MSRTNILLEVGTNELEVVEFTLNEQLQGQSSAYQGHYAVNVAKVLEIIRMPRITELPRVSNPSVLGAFNLRSHIIPLVDLGVWLGKAQAEPEEEGKVIVTEFNSVVTAFRVSGVNRIHRISWEEVESPGPYLASFSSDCITGVINLEGRIVFVLDMEKIVADLDPGMALRMDVDLEEHRGKALKALVADDSSLIRNMLRDLLEKAGFSVETTFHGQELWERLQALRRKAETEGNALTDHVQIVIADIEMPTMDGLTLCKKIKEDPHLGQLPVILFSSLISDKLRHRGEAAGADDQISKPEITQLTRRARALIEARRTTM
ncbi:two-component system, chemotaxis family, response regulator CheV [Desulfonatronum thiosulfatophilum]|uniref:Two-component system, chemotaxis family, response regulator CheV n=1 Tax=Desulfonatronum thiosulfatophilum TaxID=617002 RepID=A0A1G6ER06_9BACT|nr:chemotaxis protein [Desulfonatronum thiosulfatophilum]SDB59841.1 two-component system, chemotaxis family, response regulator CheV [Desulfonatronum thiosulfatophilum]